MLRPLRARGPVAPARFSLPLVLSVVLAVGGCSFRLVRPAPPQAEWPSDPRANPSQAACMSSPAPPIADTALVAALGTLAYLERNSGAPTLALGLAIVAVPFLVSAVYGTYHVTNCRRYNAHFNDAR